MAAKAARKQNWLYPSCHKGNPQLTVQTSFPFPLPSRNSTSIVSDSNMDKKVRGERTITPDNQRSIHLDGTETLA